MFFENIAFDNMNDIKNNKELFNLTDSFMLGNSFKDEYNGYKNYSVNYISSNTQKGQLLLKIYELDFAINDLSLYLDLHEDDKDIYLYFKKCTDKYRELVNEYERKYGPLEIDESNYDNYEWVQGKWPFEGGNI